MPTSVVHGNKEYYHYLLFLKKNVFSTFEIWLDFSLNSKSNVNDIFEKCAKIDTQEVVLHQSFAIKSSSRRYI